MFSLRSRRFQLNQTLSKSRALEVSLDGSGFLQKKEKGQSVSDTSKIFELSMTNGSPKDNQLQNDFIDEVQTEMQPNNVQKTSGEGESVKMEEKSSNDQDQQEDTERKETEARTEGGDIMICFSPLNYCR